MSSQTETLERSLLSSACLWLPCVFFLTLFLCDSSQRYVHLLHVALLPPSPFSSMRSTKFDGRKAMGIEGMNSENFDKGGIFFVFICRQAVLTFPYLCSHSSHFLFIDSAGLYLELCPCFFSIFSTIFNVFSFRLNEIPRVGNVENAQVFKIVDIFNIFNVSMLSHFARIANTRLVAKRPRLSSMSCFQIVA